MSHHLSRYLEELRVGIGEVITIGNLQSDIQHDRRIGPPFERVIIAFDDDVLSFHTEGKCNLTFQPNGLLVCGTKSAQKRLEGNKALVVAEEGTVSAQPRALQSFHVSHRRSAPMPFHSPLNAHHDPSSMSMYRKA